MIKYNENMAECTKEDIRRLNRFVRRINKRVRGKWGKTINVVLTPDNETESVDIYLQGDLWDNFLTFKEAIQFLSGVNLGIMLGDNCGTPNKD